MTARELATALNAEPRGTPRLHRAIPALEQPATALNAEPLEITYTVFPSTTTNSKDEHRAPWPAFCALLAEAKPTAVKKFAKLVKLATFGNGPTSGHTSLRSDDNVLQVFGIEGDYDGELVGPQRAVELLERHTVRAVVATTWTHQPDKPRWRIYAPLSKPVAPPERKRLMAALNGMLGGILARESFTLSQSYFFGPRPDGEYLVLPTFGDPAKGLCLDALDPVALDALAVYPAGDNGKAAPAHTVTPREGLASVAAVLEHFDTTPPDSPREHIRCPLPDHEDRHPSFRADADVMWVCTCGGGDSDRLAYLLLGGPRDISDRALWNKVGDLVEQLGGTRRPDDTLRKARWTDDGCARRLAAFTENRLRFCHPWRTWLRWDGTRWARCDAGEHVHVARALVAALLEIAKGIHDDKERREFYGSVISLEGEARRKRMFEAAQSLLSVTPDDLDADVWLVNCRNGVLKLRTGALLPHDPAHMLSKQVPVAFEPNAECPQWLAFLKCIMGGNDALVAFLARAVGYTLTGDTRERVLFLLHGQGRNGKSTFLEVLRALLGDYARATGFDTFAQAAHANPGAASPELVRLVGTRFVSAAEAEAGRRLSTEVIKQVTGQDTITARGLWEAPVEFRPAFKLWLAANYRPRITDTTDSIWDRVRLIPFTVRIPEAEVDRDLFSKLRGELPGILAWAVRGCLDWQRDGLGVPDEVLAATRGYREEEDAVARFLAQCVEPPAGDGAVPTTAHGDLYTAFDEWSQEAGERALSSRRLAQELRVKQVGERHPGNKLVWEVKLKGSPRF